MKLKKKKRFNVKVKKQAVLIPRFWLPAET
jgi:hypothetical protein